MNNMTENKEETEDTFEVDSVSKKEIIKKVSKSCGYKTYEVQDVLDAYHKVLINILIEGKSFKLGNIAEISLRKSKPKKLHGMFEGYTTSIIKVKYRTMPALSRILKQNVVTD